MEAVDYPIHDLVPHRGPMCLLDAMLEADPLNSVCEATIREDAIFLEDDAVPAQIGIEYMAQAIAAHGGWLSQLKGEPVKVGFLLGAPRWNIHRGSFQLGQTLRIEVSQDWGDDELRRFDCLIKDKDSGEVMQDANINVLLPNDLQKYLSASRATEGL